MRTPLVPASEPSFAAAAFPRRTSVRCAYQELILDCRREASHILPALRERGLLNEYVSYGPKNDMRIACGAWARIAVSAGSISGHLDGQEISPIETKDPLRAVNEILASLPVNEWCAYGYLSFDLARYYYPYSVAGGQNELVLIVPESEIRIHNDSIRIRTLAALGPIKDAILSSVKARHFQTQPIECADIEAPSAEAYRQSVARTIEQIRAGGLEKAIISRRFEVPGRLDEVGCLSEGSKINGAASRSYCLDLFGRKMVGFSPEIMLTADGRGLITTNPLAGTRPRATGANDRKLTQELFSDAKEVKEHALSVREVEAEMLSVCKPNSVRIYNFMGVNRQRTVQHLSTRISGRLKSNNTSWDALAVIFPGVTVTGIRKHEALRLIAELEPGPRGLYAGAVGWVDWSGAADWGIAIRGLVQSNGKIVFQAGAGIVAESNPEREYLESVNKMRAMSSSVVLA